MKTIPCRLKPTTKPDDAPGMWTIAGGPDSPLFATREEAEEWVDGNIAGGAYSIDWLDWCERCHDYTYQIYERGRWIAGCHVCDATYLAARKDEMQKLVAWTGNVSQ